MAGATSSLETLRAIWKERLDDGEESGDARILRAYEGLKLHPKIARVASKRYKDGHYADAVESAVKALNQLVRLRSESELDGSKLMEAVFNPSTPG